jgi:phospholipid/cholesterol/gamma-HCH transport system substrate-binding protein
MPQRKEIRWAELRVGVMVAASLVVLAVAIFLISGQLGFITSKYTLYTYFATASGLRPGSQVQLAGIPAGTVKDVRISKYHDPERAVEIVVQIARKFQPEIREDSVANQTTAGLLGEAYLDISRGNPNQRVIQNGGVIKSSQEADIKQIEANANDVISNLRVLSASLNDITGQITQGKGSIGKLLYNDTFYNQLNETVKSANALISNVQKGQGTIGKLLVDDTAYNKLVATENRLNDFIDQAEHGQGTMGRFMSDPTVYNQLKDLTAKMDVLVNNINEGHGTLGKLATDQQLYDRVNATAGHIEAVTARMDQGTGTLGKLSTDPTLYNNLSASTTSLKEFLDEFRKNPRKYLTLHLHIF